MAASSPPVQSSAPLDPEHARVSAWRMEALAEALPASSLGLDSLKSGFTDAHTSWAPLLGRQLAAHIQDGEDASDMKGYGSHDGGLRPVSSADSRVLGRGRGVVTVDAPPTSNVGYGFGGYTADGSSSGGPRGGVAGPAHVPGPRRAAAVRGAMRSLAAEDPFVGSGVSLGSNPLGSTPLVEPLLPGDGVVPLGTQAPPSAAPVGGGPPVGRTAWAHAAPDYTPPAYPEYDYGHSYSAPSHHMYYGHGSHGHASMYEAASAGPPEGEFGEPGGDSYPGRSHSGTSAGYGPGRFPQAGMQAVGRSSSGYPGGRSASSGSAMHTRPAPSTSMRYGASGGPYGEPSAPSYTSGPAYDAPFPDGYADRSGFGDAPFQRVREREYSGGSHGYGGNSGAYRRGPAHPPEDTAAPYYNASHPAQRGPTAPSAPGPRSVSDVHMYGRSAGHMDGSRRSASGTVMGYGAMQYGGPSGYGSTPDDPARPGRIKQYRDREWQLFRVLLLRRLSAITRRREHGIMSSKNLRTAMLMFGLPTTVLDLVSRPHAPRGGSHTQAGRREPVPEPLTPGDDVDLSMPGELSISDDELARLPNAGLPEEALGWWPAGGVVLDAATSEASTRRSSTDVDGSSVPTSDASTVATEPVDTHQQLMAAANIAAMAAELVARRRFKTKLCHAWLRSGGHCPRGSNCDYAHGSDELRQVGEPRDGRYKSKLCRSFLDSLGTFCSHGERCSFAHGVHELRIRFPDSPEEVEEALAAIDGPEVGADRADRGGVTLVSGSSVSPSGMNASLRRFKPMLCREWLQGAADAAAAAAAKLSAGAPASSLRIDPARAGARRCKRGAMCPHAHGLSELRLPSVMEQVKLIQALACESPHAASGVATGEKPDPPVSLRDQTLLLVASGLLTPCLPPAILHRISSAAALMGRAPVIPSSGILPDFDGMPPAMAKALTAAIHNPMLQVVLPYASSAGSTPWGYNDPSASPGGGNRMGLAKIIATVGNDAADAALVTAGVAMGAVRLPAHLTAPPSPDMMGEDSADPRISTATGRYGALMRRRTELQSQVAASSAAH